MKRKLALVVASALAALVASGAVAQATGGANYSWINWSGQNLAYSGNATFKCPKNQPSSCEIRVYLGAIKYERGTKCLPKEHEYASKPGSFLKQVELYPPDVARGHSETVPLSGELSGVLSEAAAAGWKQVELCVYRFGFEPPPNTLGLEHLSSHSNVLSVG